MSVQDDLREFLTTRRARVSPADVGLPVYTGNRRVAGLRREEVAILAGISVEYYVRLERGQVGSVSDGVLEGLAHALRLDEAEVDHLHRLVRTAGTPPRRRAAKTPARPRVRPVVQRLLDTMPMPAYLRDARFDILAANEAGRALYSPVYASVPQSARHAQAAEPPNTARFLFCDPAAVEFFVDHESVLDDCVAYLRAEAGRDPYDTRLSDLVGELTTRSDDFARRWAHHDVRNHRTGTKRLRHPVVGELELDFEALELSGDPGQRINVYTAAPDTRSAEGLQLLATWAATERVSATSS